MLANAQQNHVNFQPAFSKIISAIGKTCAFEIKNPIYQNHFMSRTDIYQKYVKEYLSPAMDVITNDKEINALAMLDSNYSKLTKTDAGFLKDKIGIDYYPMVPFLLERLFSVFCQNEKINVKYNDL